MFSEVMNTVPGGAAKYVCDVSNKNFHLYANFITAYVGKIGLWKTKSITNIGKLFAGSSLTVSFN